MYFFQFQKIPPRVKFRHESDYFTKIPTKSSIFLSVQSSPNPDPLKTSRPSILSTITTRKFVRQLFTNRTKAEKQSSSCRISRQCEKRQIGRPACRERSENT